MRIGVETRSAFHDGFDTHWYHVKCAHRKLGGKKMSELRHHETLRWSDQKTLRQLFEGRDVPDDPVLKERSDRLWQVRDLISSCCKPKVSFFVVSLSFVSFWFSFVAVLGR